MLNPTWLMPQAILHTVTFTPLAANGVYTSTFQQVWLEPLVVTAAFPVGPFPRTRLVGWVISDQNGTLNAQWSTDGTTVNATSVDIPYVAANGKQFFSILCDDKYIRLRYTNGSVAQLVFGLVAYLMGQEPG
jgi:hypothetical protein